MTSDTQDSAPSEWTRIAGLTLILCGVAGAVDSFDTQMIGFTGAQIAADLKFPVADLGWLFGAGQLGGVAGALLFGSLADRFGTFRMLVLTTLIAALFTAIALTANNYGELLACRMATGLGLGGMMPCFLGLGIATMPSRGRVFMTTILYASFPAGGVVGAWISTPLMSAYGWRGVFSLAVALLVTITGLLLLLPITKARPARTAEAGRVSSLFSRALRPTTLWIWALFLLAPTGVYLLALWMPALLQLLGVGAGQTSLLVGFLNLGGLAFAVCGGWLMQRYRSLWVILPVLLMGALGFSAIATVYRDFYVLVGVTTLSGAALGGGMALLVSMAANAYPAPLRATGIGWAMGIARIGQMSAPVPIGLLLRGGVTPQTALAICGVPTLISLIPLVMADRAIRRRARTDADK